MPRRHLVLRRDPATDLTTDELRAVSGGDSLGCLVTKLSVRDCLSLPLTECTILQETQTITCPTDVC